MVVDTSIVEDTKTTEAVMVEDMEITGTVVVTGLAMAVEAMVQDMAADMAVGTVIQAMVVMAAALVEGMVVAADMAEVEDTVVVAGTVVDPVVPAILEVDMVQYVTMIGTKEITRYVYCVSSKACVVICDVLE